MDLYQILVTIGNAILWTVAFGILCSCAWVIWVYGTNLPSHSDMSEEDEKKLLESIKEGKGIRASEMGVNND